MSDTTQCEFRFEEIPVKVQGTEVAMVSGVATLEGETHGSYGFAVVGIVLDGNNPDDYRDKRQVELNPHHDAFQTVLFHQVKVHVQDDLDASDAFKEACRAERESWYE